MGRPVVAIAALALLSCGPAVIPAEPPHTDDGTTRAPAPAAERYIATIAVDDYSHTRPLRGAVADANAITAAFRDRLRFRTEADDAALSLHDAGATAQALDGFLHHADGPLAQIPDDAMLVLYVALHGRSRPCKKKVCGEILLRDSEEGHGYAVGDLLARLDELPVRHILLLLDTCDSGMALGGEPWDRIDYDVLREPAVHRISRKVITASSVKETADDGDPKRRGRFAAALLDGLSGEADLFPDGNVLFVELAVYLQAEVTRRSLADARTGKKRQQPEFGGFLSDGRGSPSLGPLAPARGAADETLGALMDEAKQHLEANDARRAQGVLARYLLVRSHQVWTARRAVEEARALAARGQPVAAIERLDELRRSAMITSPASDAAIAQYQARLARSGPDTAALAERREAEARGAALEAGRGLDRRGRGAMLDGLGAVATITGADRAAAVIAEAALPLVEAAPRRAIAGDAAVAFAVTGDAARASALRAAEGVPPRAATESAPETANRPALVPIAPGAFTMGSPEGEAGRYGDEQTHRVRLTRGFLMAETEVTQAQYAALMGTNPAYFQGAAEDGQRPVESVSWLDAVKYCNALSKAEGLAPAYVIEDDEVTWDQSAGGYRLPTEAEWEYAARAGTATATYAGDLDIRGLHNAPALDDIAWYGGNSGSAHPKAVDSSGWEEKQHPHEQASTHPVKGKRPNGWGLYDMLGNVYEWTWDRYAAEHPEGPAGAPLADPAGPAHGADRVIRGGSFYDRARWVRSAVRFSGSPGDRFHWLGFRPVRAPRAP